MMKEKQMKWQDVLIWLLFFTLLLHAYREHGKPNGIVSFHFHDIKMQIKICIFIFVLIFILA